MKPSRNGPCPCGSNKKYKRCCLASGRFESEQEDDSPAAQLTKAKASFAAGDDSIALHMALHLQQRHPDLAGAWKLAGDIEFQQERFERARAHYSRAAELNPDDPLTLYHLASCMALSDEKAKAVDLFQRALALKPGFHQAQLNLGNTLRDLGRSDEAAACYLDVFRSGNASIKIMSHILLSMHLFELKDYQPLFDMHCQLGKLITDANTWKPPTAATSSQESKPKIRLGYLSPRFSGEIVGYFFKPVFDNHDRDRFELYLYSATERVDETTEYFAERADKWTDVTTLSDHALCDQIQKDGIDILIDLAGHAPENRLGVVAAKPAPVVVSMIDYFDTTGVAAVDYYITDSYSTPANTQQQFIEKLIRLDQPRLVYQAPAYAPPVKINTDINDPIRFGSFNRHHKITPKVVALWAQLLDAVPGSTLLLKNKAFAEADVQARYKDQFMEHGIGAERIVFDGASPHADMLAQYGDIDIALDTFPYNGGLTTCEALWMGTPVIALLGDRIISRQSAAMLAAVGLEGFVAKDANRFVEIGRYWTENRQELTTLRLTLRERMTNSPLTNGANYTHAIEHHFTVMGKSAGDS